MYCHTTRTVSEQPKEHDKGLKVQYGLTIPHIPCFGVLLVRGVDFMGFRVLSHDTLWHKSSVLKPRISAPTPLGLAVPFALCVGLPDARAHLSIYIT